MYNRIRKYVTENQMIDAGKTVIAGVSGGGDSMAMLDFLRKYQGEFSFSLQVLHVHHGIRGNEADRDCELVKKTCREWELPCQVYFYDVPKLAARWKAGMEEAARTVRKEAFVRERERLGLVEGEAVFAFAHNCNDLAETMLHHLARGTGIRGLSVMRPAIGNVIRPVLCLDREEIAHYLEENQIPYILDSSNLSDDYTRNRIRHNILPLLEQQVNSRAAVHMAETARLLAQAEDYLARQGEALLLRCEREAAGWFLGEDFFEAEPVIQTYALGLAFEKLAGKRKDFTSLHVDKVQRLADMQTGKEISLPYGLKAQKTYGGIRLFRVEEGQENPAGEEGKEWELLVPGTLKCPLGSFEVKIFPYENQKIEEKKCTKWLDYDKLYGSLCVRTRQAGDFMVVSRDGSRKKLSRILIDEKVPRADRDALAVVACGREVLWIAGGRMNENYKITPHTTRVLELSCEGGNCHE